VKKEIALAVLIVAGGCKKVDSDNRRIGNPNAVSPVSPSSPVETVALTDSGPVQAPICGVSRSTKLTDQGVGDLQIGRPVSEVKRLCNVVSDFHRTTADGRNERIVTIQTINLHPSTDPTGSEIMVAQVANDRIASIEISTARFTTSDSLGVDTPLRRIARMRGAQFAPGEDGVYGFVGEHCGLSFRFSLPLRPPKGGEWTVAAIDKDHGDATVDKVLVKKCG
jgi:hypothetical protein